jgi:DNA invertase Pin-like site-specific DNA recombinase
MIPPGRVFSYARVSSTGQVGDDRDGLGRQVAMAIAWCEQHGHALDPLSLVDAGVSAYRGKNRAGGALGMFLDKASTGELGPTPTLLIEDLDRFSRDQPLDAVEALVTDVVRAGVTIVSLRDQLVVNRATLTDDLGTWVRMLAGIHGAHAYSKRLSERIVSARKTELAAMRDGQTRRPNTRPFWIDHTDGTFVLNAKADIVRLMFEWCVDRNWGANRIARELDARGHRTPRGGRWSTRAVLNTLTAPTCIGLYQPHRIVHGEETGPNGRMIRSKTREPAGEAFPRYPAVVSEGRWHLAQQRIAGRLKQGGPKTRLRSPLQGLVTCACCKQPLTATSSAKNGLRYEYVRCGVGQYSKAICGGPLRVLDLTAMVLYALPQEGWQQFFPEQGENIQVQRSRAQLVALQEGLVALQTEHRNMQDAVRKAAAAGSAALALMLNMQDAVDLKQQEIDEREQTINRIKTQLAEIERQTQPEEHWDRLMRQIAQVMQRFGSGQDTAEDRIELHDQLVAMGMRFELDLRAKLLEITWNGVSRMTMVWPDADVVFLHRGITSGGPPVGDESWGERLDREEEQAGREMLAVLRGEAPRPAGPPFDYPAEANRIRHLVAVAKYSTDID